LTWPNPDRDKFGADEWRALIQWATTTLNAWFLAAPAQFAQKSSATSQSDSKSAAGAAQEPLPQLASSMEIENSVQPAAGPSFQQLSLSVHPPASVAAAAALPIPQRVPVLSLSHASSQSDSGSAASKPSAGKQSDSAPVPSAGASSSEAGLRRSARVSSTVSSTGVKNAGNDCSMLAELQLLRSVNGLAQLLNAVR